MCLLSLLKRPINAAIDPTVVLSYEHAMILYQYKIMNLTNPSLLTGLDSFERRNPRQFVEEVRILFSVGFVHDVSIPTNRKRNSDRRKVRIEIEGMEEKLTT